MVLELLLTVLKRWLFWINLPLCGIALFLIPVTLKVPYETPPIVSGLKKVDWVGTVMFIASVTGFLIPISWVSCTRNLRHKSKTQLTLVRVVSCTRGRAGEFLYHSSSALVVS
jgi:ABC-type antimicrobial peptide transport system permease subunit